MKARIIIASAILFIVFASLGGCVKTTPQKTAKDLVLGTWKLNKSYRTERIHSTGEVRTTELPIQYLILHKYDDSTITETSNGYMRSPVRYDITMSDINIAPGSKRHITILTETDLQYYEEIVATGLTLRNITYWVRPE